MKERVAVIFAFLLLCGLTVFFCWDISVGQNKTERDQQNVKENDHEMALRAAEWVKETSEDVISLFPGHSGVEKKAKYFKSRAIALKKELLACKNGEEREMASEKIRKITEELVIFTKNCRRNYMNRYEQGIEQVGGKTVVSM